MSKYTEACGDDATTLGIIAPGNVSKKGIIGYYEEAFWAADSFEFASILAAKDQANWDAAVQAGNLVYLGKGKYSDQSTEAEFFEDAPLDIREETSPATKVVRSEGVYCSCTHAEIKKMDGRGGRVFFRSSNGYLVARMNDDGTIIGRPISSMAVANRTVPTNETPVEYTPIDFTFSDNKGDERNPAELKLDFLFSEVNSVFSAIAVVSGESSNGSTLSATLAITKDCGEEFLAGIVQGNLEAFDEDGNSLVIATWTENSSDYSIGITTALTLAYVRFTGIIDVAGGGVLYYMDQVRISTT